MANEHVTVAECQVWLEKTKANLGSALDSELEAAAATIVLGRIAQAFDVSTWIDPPTTPLLVRKVISMYYAAAFYARQYSEDEDAQSYARDLRAWADTLIAGIVDGTIDLVDVTTQEPPGGSGPIFYPDDESSSQVPTPEDPSLGPESFSMGTVF